MPRVAASPTGPAPNAGPERKSRLRPALLALFLAAALVVCGGCDRPPEPPAPPDATAARPAAPDFTLRRLDGDTLRLSDLRGKVVFVNIWATWCPPCRQEVPSMVRLYERFRDRGLEIVAVSEDRDPEAVRRFVARYRVPFPVVMDRDKAVYRAYRATGVPETHLIDKQGRVVRSVIGGFDWEAPEVVAAVASLLAR